jgi:multiple sugar transport system permease protein
MSASAIRRGVATYLIVGFFAVLLAFPFYWMGMTAFKTFADLLSLQNIPFKFNPSPTLENFRFLWQDTHYPRWLLNTALIGIVVVVITLVFSVPAGYALARLSGRWGGTMGIIVFLTYLVPPTLLFLPLSRVISDLGLQDKIYSLMLVYPSFTVPFSTWLLMGFFKTIPRELEDAALVDGATRLRTLVSVIFPVSIPGILTVVIFTFSLCVNEFIYAITFISSSSHRTISAGVPTDLIRGDLVNWGGIAAAVLIPAIPLALLYNLFLDRFIAGFTGGAFR